MRKLVKVYEHKKLAYNDTELDVLRIVDVTYANLAEDGTAKTIDYGINLVPLSDYLEEPYLYDTDIMCYGLDERELFLSDLREYFVDKYFTISGADGRVILTNVEDLSIVSSYYRNDIVSRKKHLNK